MEEPDKERLTLEEMFGLSRRVEDWKKDPNKYVGYIGNISILLSTADSPEGKEYQISVRDISDTNNPTVLGSESRTLQVKEIYEFAEQQYFAQRRVLKQEKVARARQMLGK